MKNYILVILLCCTNACFGDPMDNIKTKGDLLKFLGLHLQGQTDEFLFSAQARAAGMPMQYTHVGTDSFYITDLDKNGHEDLIIDGTGFYIFLGQGYNKFEKHYLTGSTTNYSYSGLRKTDSINHLLVRVSIKNGDGTFKTYDTAIVYKDQSFVEHITHPTTHTIEKIEYQYSPGFCIECEDYKMVIKRAHSEYKRLSTVLNNMRFTELEDHYMQMAFDVSSGVLTIHYDNGKKKTITDYGLAGTLALRQLYLRFDQIQSKLNKKRGW